MSAGNITRRGEQSFRIKYEAGPPDPMTGKRKTVVETVRGTRRDARRLLTQRLGELDSGIAVDPSRVTLAEHLREWITGTTHLATKTRGRYEALIEQQVVPHLGRIALQKLRPADIQKWHATLLNGGGKDGRPLSARTVGHAHRALHTALAHAVAAEKIGRNVASLVHPPKVDAEEVVVLTAEQIAAMLAGLAGHRLLPIAAVAVGAGLRRGELCGLRWGDIELDVGRLRVTAALERTKAGLMIKEPKTRHGRRSIVLPEFAATALREQWRQQSEQRLKVGLGRAGSDDLVFTLDDGSPWDPDYLSHHWRRTLAARGLPHIGLHGLRHSHASALIAGGVDPLTISRRLGHGTAAFTLATYGHLFADTDGAAAKALDAALRTKP